MVRCLNAGMLEHGVNVDSLQRHMSFVTYESHVLFALRFMVDCGLVGGNWVELKAGTYNVLNLEVPSMSTVDPRLLLNTLIPFLSCRFEFLFQLGQITPGFVRKVTPQHSTPFQRFWGLYLRCHTL